MFDMAPTENGKLYSMDLHLLTRHLVCFVLFLLQVLSISAIGFPVSQLCIYFLLNFLFFYSSQVPVFILLQFSQALFFSLLTLILLLTNLSFIFSPVLSKVAVLFYIFLLAKSSYFFRYAFFFSLLAPVIIQCLVFCSLSFIFVFVISVLLSCLVESCHVGYSSALLHVSSLVTDSPDLAASLMLLQLLQVSRLWFPELLPCLHHCLCIWSCLIPGQPVLLFCALPFCLDQVPASPILCCRFTSTELHLCFSAQGFNAM